MLKYLNVTIATLLLAGCGGGSSAPDPVVVTPPPTPTPVDQFADLRSVAQSQVASSDAPAVSIAIMKDGEIIFAEAYGTKVHNGDEQVDPQTLFQLGSTTKMFTATAALQLIDENVITLETSLPSALPGITLSAEQIGWNDISIEHLLTHQGGFEDHVDWDGSSDLMNYALNTFPTLSGQMNPAGKFFNYSNPNWSYLGAIVEHHRGVEYTQVMEDMVFEPLGMARTTMSYEQVEADGNYALGVGVAVVNGELVDLNAQTLEQVAQTPFGTPAGAYTWSTASELVKMGDFLLNGNSDVLSAALSGQISTAQVGMGRGLPQSYGYGVFINEGVFKNDQWMPLKVWEHGGNTLSYSNMFWVLPEQNVTIAVMSSGYSTDFSDTMFAAVDSVMEAPAAIAVPWAPVATELFDNHAGQYLLDFGVIDIINDDGQLKLSSAALDSAGVIYEPNLNPISASMFIVTVDGEQLDLTFFPEEVGGQSIYIRNRDFVGIREGELAASLKRLSDKPVKLSPMPVSLN